MSVHAFAQVMGADRGPARPPALTPKELGALAEDFDRAIRRLAECMDDPRRSELEDIVCVAVAERAVADYRRPLAAFASACGLTDNLDRWVGVDTADHLHLFSAPAKPAWIGDNQPFPRPACIDGRPVQLAPAGAWTNPGGLRQCPACAHEAYLHPDRFAAALNPIRGDVADADRSRLATLMLDEVRAALPAVLDRHAETSWVMFAAGEEPLQAVCAAWAAELARRTDEPLRLVAELDASMTVAAQRLLASRKPGEVVAARLPAAEWARLLSPLKPMSPGDVDVISSADRLSYCRAVVSALSAASG